MKKKEKITIKGVPANVIIVPLEIILAVLLFFIFILVLETNRSSNELADLIERFGVYQQDETDLQTGINILSETAVTYIQTPVTGDGAPNVGPLKAYANELGRDRRGPQIAERFRDYQVSDEVRGYIDHASEVSVEMMEIQIHAISLMRSAYPLPPIPELSAIPEVPLTPEELAMSEEARVGAAKRMLLNQDYARMRYAITEDVGNGSFALQQEFSRLSAETRHHVAVLRTALWIMIVAVVIMLFSGFALLRIWMIRPLRKHAAEITADESMKQVSGVREMRVLVDAYNALLSRRNKLEAILRSAAETDALTGLPNRYSLERYVLETGEDNGPMAVVIFDINFLKQINDREGHLAGDKLIRTAGSCIRECFASESEDNCYRIGGDEFAVILRDCGEEEIKARLARFELALEREDISVSAGYALAEETDEESFRKLMGEADERMYENKKRVHGSGPYPIKE